MAFLNNNGGLMWKPQNSKPGGGIITKPPSSAGSARPPEIAKPPNNGGSNVIKPPTSSAGTGSGWKEEAKPPNNGGSNVIKPPSYAGSGSTGSSYTPPSSTGGSGSAGFVGVNDTDQQKIKDQMNANSQAWHTADTDTKTWLQNENKRLSELLGGSVSFDSSTGKWSGTAGVTSGPDYTDISSKLDEYYGGISAAEQAAIDAAIKSGIAGLEGQKYGINQSAEEAAKQAYIGYMQSKAVMPQALAAAGYSGGMADSQRLALDTTLQNNQKDILLNRDNALNDIETAIQKTRLEGSIQGAQSQAQLGRDALNAYLSYINQKNAQASQDYWNKYGYDFQGGQSALDREHQAGMQQGSQNWQSGENDKDRVQSAQQKARDDVINLLLGGFMPGDDMLTSAGIDKNTAKGWLEYARQQAQKATRSSIGGTDGYIIPDNTPKKTGPSQKEISEADAKFDSGDYSPEVIDIMLAGGADPDGMAASQGFKRDITSLGFGPITMDALANLLVNGAVIPLDMGGKRYYKKAATGNNNIGWDFLPTAGGFLR